MNGFDSPEFGPAEEAARDANIRDIVRINESKLNSAHQKIADLEKALIKKDAQLEILSQIITDWGGY